jgi:hypothetical protein
LPETEFAIRSKATGRRHTKCKPCQRAYAKQHYSANAEAYGARTGARNRDVKAAYHAVLNPLIEDGICSCCGVPHGKQVEGKPTRLVFVRKEGYAGAPLHDIVRKARGQAAFEEALKHSELKCDRCAFKGYEDNIKPMQFGMPNATNLRSHSGRAPYSLLRRPSVAV